MALKKEAVSYCKLCYIIHLRVCLHLIKIHSVLKSMSFHEILIFD